MSAPGGPRQATVQAAQAKPLNELEQFCQDRLDNARRESIPISRHQVANELGRKFNLRFREAFDVVDEFCDERSPGTPQYLGKEFLVPYMKLTSLVFAALAVVAVIVSCVKFRPGDKQFTWGLALAVLFGLIAGGGYVRGLLREFAADK